MLLKKNAVILAGLQAKTLTINASAIDISNDDSLGWRELLEEAGEKSIDISCNGVIVDTILIDIIASSGLTSVFLADITLETAQGDRFTGNFFLDSYEETGTYNEKVTFSATLKSSGIIAFAPVI